MSSIYDLPNRIISMASPSTMGLNNTVAPNATNGSQYPQMALLDLFFPGFSIFANAVEKYLKIDLNLYIPLVLLVGLLMLAWNYASQYIWEQIETYFMSVVDIRTDDEIYNILMAWVAAQRFSQGARRFVVNTNLSSRTWFLAWFSNDDDDDDTGSRGDKKKAALSYTPSFGAHYFWYRGRLLLFRRTSNREQSSFMLVSEREEISIACFGRSPWILKELLHEARQQYIEKDEQKTVIYRGTTRSGSAEPTWQRSLARATRPFSTVILNERTKKEVIDDVTDYLCPSTQRWYSNRGIPYRRGYLLYGPPGTGKSSLSLALAGFFKMRIYMVSLSSPAATEENLASLFAELPRRCVVLLEDIDSAGLTHTREESGNQKQIQPADSSNEMEPGQVTPGNGNTVTPPLGGRLSLSGLLNILDGVPSQEGRVLIMTTNHLEKLDKALIRPGRVDMIVKFGLSDKDMTSSIFRAIYARLEGDDVRVPAEDILLDAEARKTRAEEKVRKRAEEDARVQILAEQFASKIPAHEFSPAELQGYLMKHKRNAEAAVENAEAFVEETRKDRKEKELKEAEERRKAEEQKKAEEAKKQAEDEKAKAKEKSEESKTEEAPAAEASEPQPSPSTPEVTQAKDKSEESKSDKAPAAEASEPQTSPTSPEAAQASVPGVPQSDKSPDATGTLEVKTEQKHGHARHDSGYGTPTSNEL